jgi:PEP-CTERM motif
LYFYFLEIQMNFKLKALVATTVATITMSGAANAININEMFLVASDASGTKTFIAALGAAGPANAFAGTSSLSFNYSGDANWTNFLTGSTDVVYQVLGFAPAVLNSNSYNVADEFVLTSNNTLGTFNNSSLNGVMSNAGTTGSTLNQFLQNFNVGVTGSGTKYVVGSGPDGIGSVGTAVFGGWSGTDTTAALGTNLNFWNVSRGTAINGAGQTVRTRFIGEAGDTTPDYWNLNSAGVLSYSTVTAVPEADTWAMMLLGLGFMGFVARRKQA